MAIEVRQRQFAFGTRDDGNVELVTGDLNFCTGLAAIHPRSGLVFLAHLDATWNSASLKSALLELKTRVPNLEELELFDVAGAHPLLSVFFAATFVVPTWFISHSWPDWDLLAVLLLWFGFAYATRIRMRYFLWKMGFKQPLFLSGRHAKGNNEKWWKSSLDIRLGPDGTSVPALTLTHATRATRDPRYEVSSDAGTFRSAIQGGILGVWKWYSAGRPLKRARGSS